MSAAGFIGIATNRAGLEHTTLASAMEVYDILIIEHHNGEASRLFIDGMEQLLLLEPQLPEKYYLHLYNHVDWPDARLLHQCKQTMHRAMHAKLRCKSHCIHTISVRDRRVNKRKNYIKQLNRMI